MGKASRERALRSERRLGPYERVARAGAPPIPGVPDSRGGLGSDVVVRGDVLGRCYLCHEGDKVLLRSHVTPKWAAKVMKAQRNDAQQRGDRPRGSAYRGAPGDALTSALQDTEQHYMLCSECEQWLSPGERLLEQLSSNDPWTLAAKGIVKQHPARWVLAGDARRLAWRALLGTVVKLHYAPSTHGSLSDDQAWALAERVVVDDFRGLLAPGAIRWYNFDCNEQGEVLPNPRAMVLTGLGAYGLAELMIGGMLWFVPTTTQRSGAWRTLPHSWSLEVGDLDGHPLLPDRDATGEATEGLDFSDRWRAWPDGDPCPCGSTAPKRDCCKASWVLPR